MLEKDIELSMILKAHKSGDSIVLPLTKFGLREKRKYLVKRTGKQIIIEEIEKNA